MNALNNVKYVQRHYYTKSLSSQPIDNTLVVLFTNIITVMNLNNCTVYQLGIIGGYFRYVTLQAVIIAAMVRYRSADWELVWPWPMCLTPLNLITMYNNMIQHFILCFIEVQYQYSLSKGVNNSI